MADVELDLWKPYITSTKEHVADAEKKIASEEVRVAGLLGGGVDTVRRQEHRELPVETPDALPHPEGRSAEYACIVGQQEANHLTKGEMLEFMVLGRKENTIRTRKIAAIGPQSASS